MPSPERNTRHIGVVIPAYNADRFLADAIGSVLAQTLPAAEIVVIDDGSDDATATIADGFAANHPALRVVHQTNSGLVAARNRGLDELAAGTDLVLFLDADDLLVPTCLERLADRLAAVPGAVGAYGLPSMFEEGQRPRDQPIETTFGYDRVEVVGRGLRHVPLDEPTRFECLVVWVAVCTAGQLLIERSHLEAAGAFSPAVPIGEDWDTWLRLTTRGPLAFLPEIVMHKREVPGSLSSNGRRLADAEPKIRARLQQLPIYGPEHRAVARVGELYGDLQRFSWARAAAANGEYLQALRNAARGTLLLARTVRRRAAAHRSPERAGRPRSAERPPEDRPGVVGQRHLGE